MGPGAILGAIDAYATRGKQKITTRKKPRYLGRFFHARLLWFPLATTRPGWYRQCRVALVSASPGGANTNEGLQSSPPCAPVAP